MSTGRLFIIGITFLISSLAFAGGESSGGGQVIRIGGALRFLDTVSDAELVLAEDLGPLEDSIVSAPASLGRDILEMKSLEAISIDISSLHKIVLRVSNTGEIDTRLLSKALANERAFTQSDRFFSNADAIACGILPSQRLPAKKQLTVGWFDGEKLHIQPYLFMSLSSRDQMAFILHEGLRYLNVLPEQKIESGDLYRPLATPQIENWVSKVMTQVDAFNY